MKKGFLRVCLLTALFLMAGTITAFADNSTYITGSKINGFQVGGMTPEEAMQTISQYSSNYYTLTIKEKGGAQETISYQDIDLGTSFQIADFQSYLHHPADEDGKCPHLRLPGGAALYHHSGGRWKFPQ